MWRSIAALGFALVAIAWAIAFAVELESLGSLPSARILESHVPWPCWSSWESLGPFLLAGTSNDHVLGPAPAMRRGIPCSSPDCPNVSDEIPR